MREDPTLGKTLKRFVDELLKIFSDNPPVTWRFRITKYRNPVFRVHYKPTGRDNDFLIVGSNYLIIIHKFFDKKFRSLFIKKNDFYGNGDGATLNFSQFGEQEHKEYLEAVKDMAKNHTDWYIRTSIRQGT